jgi:ribosomal protein L7Ae-like RNA K-turn-binding protein
VSAIRVGGDELKPLRPDTLAAAIKAAMDRRAAGLLVAAARSRSAVMGAEAVTAACERGEAALVVVACDAAASADRTQVRRAVSEGRAVSWGTKLGLGALVAKRVKVEGVEGVEGAREAGIGVVAITSPRIAAALREAVYAADACMGRADPSAAAREARESREGRETRETRETREARGAQNEGASAPRGGAEAHGRKASPHRGQSAKGGGKAGGGAFRAPGGGPRRDARSAVRASKQQTSGAAAGAAAKRRVDG